MKKLLSLLLALLLTGQLALAAFPGGENAEASEPVRAIVRLDPGSGGESPLADIPGVRVLWTYRQLFSGAAVEGTPKALAALAAADGVESVSLTRTYAQPQTGSAEAPVQSNSLPLMGAEALLDRGLNGDGVVIAVLDSGFRTSHSAFKDQGLAQSPALSREAVSAFVQGGGTPGRYISPRIPFAYDYCHGDDDVGTRDSHGTHVAALAAGYALGSDGAVLFRGAAPAAQLLAMKVFPDNADAGTDDAVVLKALEDALALGADVVNLSLGTPSGFSRDSTLDGLYAQAFQSLRQAGGILCCAAGNNGASTSMKLQGSPLPTAGYTDYGTVNAPATYPGAVAVAAADAMSYFSPGYLQAGERSIPFSDTTAQTGEAPPSLTALAGKSLALVAVPGTGTAADFAGLSLAGKLALVARGGITFTEKVQNAQAAGAAGCLIVNDQPGSILAAVDNAAIPCATLSREDGAFLRALAGKTDVTIHAQPMLVSGSGRPQMLDASSWGTAGLRLLPTFTAPGGSILSASARGDSAYRLESGTSMAAPNAAGSFAVLLQALRQRGIDDPAQAADLAEALLASTAQPMTDESGTPLSPRRQGAGLLDLAAAVDSPLVVEDPLLTLGENRQGRFTATFTLRNLSQEEQVLTLSTAVLTDGTAQVGETTYSSLSPRDITPQVAVSAPETLVLPAGEARTVQVSLAVDRDLRRELEQSFPNGFFVEGYITLTNQAGQAVHASCLGYCGDWEKAPIFEPTDFRDAVNAGAEAGALPVDLGANLAYVSDNPVYTEGRPLLGQNPYGSFPHSDKRSAIPGPASDALYTGGTMVALEFYTLRNAARIIALVSNARTGQIYRVEDAPWITRSPMDEFTYTAAPSGTFSWAGVDSRGEALPNGTRVNVSFYAWLEGDSAMEEAYRRSAPDAEDPDSYRWLLSSANDRCLAWRFPVTVDSAAPTAKAAVRGDTLSVTVTDGQFLAHAALLDSDGAVLAEDAFADDRAGKGHTLTLDLRQLEEGTETIYVTAADYAANLSGWSIDLTDRASLQPERCASALLTDVDRDAWYHQAVDFVWEKGLMTGGGTLTFRPEDGATRIQVISALYRLAGSPDPGEGECPFADVPASADFAPALTWAADLGLATGYHGDLFAPYANLSRQQLAVLLQRYAASTEAPASADPAVLAQFPDRGEISPWAESAVAWAVEAGILTGGAEGLLDPRGYVTRAELAEALMQLCGGEASAA